MIYYVILWNQYKNNCNKINQKEGFVGIHYDSKRKKYVAQIKINCTTSFLGRYDKEEDALIARLKAEKQYYGEFAPQRHLFEKYEIKW